MKIILVFLVLIYANTAQGNIYKNLEKKREAEQAANKQNQKLYEEKASKQQQKPKYDNNGKGAGLDASGYGNNNSKGDNDFSDMKKHYTKQYNKY